MPVEWTQDLAVGVKIIDEQHKEIFRRVDALLEACKAGKGKEAVGGMLTFLEEYIMEHFTAEEAIQKQYAYPSYKTHKQEHERFIKSVEALKKKFEKEGPSLMTVLETNTTVVDWLVKHIKKVDMELGAYLKLSKMKN
jgi:hemerythrin